MLLAILKKSIFSPLWKWKSLSHVWLFATPWTIQSVEFSRILEWVAFPFSRGWISPTQGSNPGLPHCRRILYQPSHKGSPLHLTLQRQLFLRFPNSPAPLFSTRSPHLFQLCQTTPKQEKTRRDYVCHSCQLRDKLRKQKLYDGGINWTIIWKKLLLFQAIYNLSFVNWVRLLIVIIIVTTFLTFLYVSNFKVLLKLELISSFWQSHALVRTEIIIFSLLPTTAVTSCCSLQTWCTRFREVELLPWTPRSHYAWAACLGYVRTFLLWLASP